MEENVESSAVVGVGQGDTTSTQSVSVKSVKVVTSGKESIIKINCEHVGCTRVATRLRRINEKAYLLCRLCAKNEDNAKEAMKNP